MKIPGILGWIALAMIGGPASAGLELQLPDIEDAILIDLPANHQSGKLYPAVFSYHGQGGSPDTTRTRAHTGPNDWIVGQIRKQTPPAQEPTKPVQPKMPKNDRLIPQNPLRR